MRIVIPNDWNDAFAQSPLMETLRQRGQLSIHKGPGPEQEAALAAAEVVVGIRERTWFLADRLAKMPQLRLIAQIGGADNPHIDVDVATQRGVLLCHTAGLAPASNVPRDALNSIAELAIGMMIAAQRHFAQQDRVIKQGGWPDVTGRTLAGKTLGIVGLGRIGGDVARAGRLFGMRVLAAGKTLTPERAAAAGAEYATLPDLFETADIVSISLKSTPATWGLVSRDLIGRMKQDALLVNTARGPVLDEPALVEALQQGRIYAALDVYNEEPLPADHPLRACDRALLLGHCGWATEEAYAHMVPSIVKVITAFLEGSPINMVNPEALQHAR